MFYQEFWNNHDYNYEVHEENKKFYMSTKECLKVWELIKQKYIEAHVLIPRKWDVEFHVHTSAHCWVWGLH